MKKMILFILCAACLLTACAKQPPVEEPREKPVVVETPQPEPVPSPVPTESIEEAAEKATFSLGPLSVTLALPEDWTVQEVTDEEQTKLQLAHEGSDGHIALQSFDSPFGVCGTGLEEVTMSLADGSEVYVGYYDGSDDWSFASFRSFNEYLAATNEGMTGDDAAQALLLLLAAEYQKP